MKMVALTDFANPRVTGVRPLGRVMPGDVFETDEGHAKDLAALGYAVAAPGDAEIGPLATWQAANPLQGELTPLEPAPAAPAPLETAPVVVEADPAEAEPLGPPVADAPPRRGRPRA